MRSSLFTVRWIARTVVRSEYGLKLWKGQLPRRDASNPIWKKLKSFVSRSSSAIKSPIDSECGNARNWFKMMRIYTVRCVWHNASEVKKKGKRHALEYIANYFREESREEQFVWRRIDVFFPASRSRVNIAIAKSHRAANGVWLPSWQRVHDEYLPRYFSRSHKRIRINCIRVRIAIDSLGRSLPRPGKRRGGFSRTTKNSAAHSRENKMAALLADGGRWGGRKARGWARRK